MISKTCPCCKITKICEEFNKARSRKGGLQPYCRECQKVKNKEKYWANREKEILRSRAKYQKHKDTSKSYHIKNQDKILAYQREYRKNNQDIIRKGWEKRNTKRRERIANDVNFKIACNLRTRLYGALRYKNPSSRSGSAVRDLGCSIPDLKQWFEQQFYPHPETGKAMTWRNYSYRGWHIDHIVPLNQFDLTDKKQFLKACHWFNLRPLWGIENMSRNKYL